MTKHQRELSGVVALIAALVLCLPQAASAWTAPPPRATTLSPTTTPPVQLIPALVIHPSVVQAVAPATAVDPPARSVGAVLPLTGPKDVVTTSVVGLLLIGLGLLLRRGAVA